MRGCLFTLLLGAVVVVVVVVVALPAVAAGVLTGGLAAAGLDARDTTVTVSSDPPTDLLGLHADRVHVRATDATFRGMRIGSLDLALGDVQILGRTAGTVDGRLSDVTVSAPGGRRIGVDRITVSGGGDAIRTTTEIPNAEVEALLADELQAAPGVRPTSIALAAPNRVTAKGAGTTLAGRFAVNGNGDLVVRGEGAAAGTEVVLLRGGEDLPVRLRSVTVTPSGGLRLAGDLTIGILG